MIENIDALAAGNHARAAFVQLGMIRERVQMMSNIGRLHLGGWLMIFHKLLFHSRF